MILPVAIYMQKLLDTVMLKFIFSNLGHSRWDVKADETMRWLHLNGPQFFTHAWVHREGPISSLKMNLNPKIGQVKAETIVGQL